MAWEHWRLTFGKFWLLARSIMGKAKVWPVHLQVNNHTLSKAIIITSTIYQGTRQSFRHYSSHTFDIENCGSEKCSSEKIWISCCRAKTYLAQIKWQLGHMSTPPKVCFPTWDDISDVISGRAGDQKDRRWVKATIIENSIGFLRPALSRLKYR